VLSFFGDSENNEGAVTEVVQGVLDPATLAGLFVEEIKP
jgi:hypothetical protein